MNFDYFKIIFYRSALVFILAKRRNSVKFKAGYYQEATSLGGVTRLICMNGLGHDKAAMLA